jgi:hypothetical protein
MFQKDQVNRQISREHTRHSTRSKLEGAFNDPIRSTGGKQVGILCIVSSIPTELCYINEQPAMKNLMMCNYSLAELNMKIPDEEPAHI